MDFYHYYLRRMTKANDKKIAAASCRDMALRLFDTGPLAWSIESGACLLSALHELDTDGVDVLPIFDEIEQALAAELQGVRLDLVADRQMRIRNTGCGRPNRRNHSHRKEQ